MATCTRRCAPDGLNLARWTGDVHLRLIPRSPAPPTWSPRRRSTRTDHPPPVWVDRRRGRRAPDHRAPRPGRAEAVWEGADELRPLDELGRPRPPARPAVAAPVPVGRLVSSPTLRCVQTLRPLAECSGLPIGTWPGLGPHAGAMGCAPPSATRRSTTPSRARTARCCAPCCGRCAGGAPSATAPARGRRVLAKGSAWFLTIAPDGTVSSFDHLPPRRLERRVDGT